MTSRSSTFSSGRRLSSTAPTIDDDQAFGQLHHVVEVGVGHLRLDHPEFGEVAAGLRLLGAEGRAEAVDPAERHGVGFVVELTALREVGGRVVEVLRRKQRRRPLARRRREDRRVGEDEAALVEEVAHGVDDLVADAQDRLLPLAADPEVPAVEQVVDAVLLRRDRVVVRRADDLRSLDVDLVAARAPACRRGRCRSRSATFPATDDRRP